MPIGIAPVIVAIISCERSVAPDFLRRPARNPRPKDSKLKFHKGVKATTEGEEIPNVEAANSAITTDL